MKTWEWLSLILGLLVLVGVAIAIFRRRRTTLKTPYPEIPVREISVGDWRLRYHQSGRGPHILLLHGIGADLFCWRFLIPVLALRYTVTALDLPGFGQSSKLLGVHYGLDEQVDRLREFLDRLKIRQTFVVGNSMGGNIALWLALKVPDLCRAVTVIAPAADKGLVPIALKSWAWLASPLSYAVGRRGLRMAHHMMVSRKDRVDQDRVEETFRTYGRNPAAIASFLAATESIRDPRLVQSLSKIRPPVLLLWGSRDRMVPRAVIDRLKTALPACQSVVHEGGGHHLQEDEPDWVGEKVDSFFSTKVI